MKSISQCWMDTIEGNGVSRESAELMNFMISDRWITIADKGSNAEFDNSLG